MWWRLFQALIAFGVVASNIRYQWTPNGYLAVIVAIGAAFIVTAALTELRAALASLRSRASRRASRNATDFE
jgi:putative exporter of polyketide antibiotics